MLPLVQRGFQHPELKVIPFGLFYEAVGGAAQHLQMASNRGFGVPARGSLQKGPEV